MMGGRKLNKYLSLIFLYNRAGYKKLLLTVGCIPLCLLIIFFVRIENPQVANSYMLVERAFGGMWPVLAFIAALTIGIFSVSSALNGKNASRSTCATTGYTMRRLCISPASAYITTFIYYLATLIIFWAVAIISIYVIGKMGLVLSGSTAVDTKLSLGLLRTEIGHALIPIAHPLILAFDIVALLGLAGECARACYLSWHNGTPSAGMALIIIPMFIVWAYPLETSYVLCAMLLVLLYTLLSAGDVISRELRPKGDPFKVNKYEGFVDLDSSEHDDNVFVEVNSAEDVYDSISALERYGRESEENTVKGLKKYSPLRLRRRYMPLGIDLQKTNFFFGICVAIGMVEHMVFYGRYLMQMEQITKGIKGVTIDSAVKMPYFWELQDNAYYGYIIAILLVLFLQAFWNYEYYNKKTKSVYVMKRLPDRKEYKRTIWVSPIIQAVAIIVIMIVHTGVDLLLYAFATPDIALPADYISYILPF